MIIVVLLVETNFIMIQHLIMIMIIDAFNYATFNDLNDTKFTKYPSISNYVIYNKMNILQKKTKGKL